MHLYQLSQQENYEICTPTRSGELMVTHERFGCFSVRQHAIGHQIDFLKMSSELIFPVRILADGVRRTPIVSVMAFTQGKTRIGMQGFRDDLVADQTMIGLIYSPDHDGQLDFHRDYSESIAVRMTLSRFREILQQDPRPETTRLFAPVLHNDTTPLRLICRRTPEINRIIEDLTTSESPFAQTLLRDARGHELFFAVIEELLRQNNAKQEVVSGRDRQKLQEAHSLLQTRLDNPPSILELAQEVGLNDFKLKKGFKALFDNTVYGVVLDARLEKAKQLLMQGKLSVTQVSLQVGYSNHGHFSAAFKKRFGMTPSQFCRQYR